MVQGRIILYEETKGCFVKMWMKGIHDKKNKTCNMCKRIVCVTDMQHKTENLISYEIVLFYLQYHTSKYIYIKENKYQ